MFASRLPVAHHRSLAAVVAVAALVLTAALAPARASAASSVSACFGVGNTSISGLYTQVEYLSGQRWYPVSGSLAHTDSFGCVRYNIAPRLRYTRLTISSAGVVPSWSTLVWGRTPQMSGFGSGWNFLGWSNMRWARLQDQSLTGSWLNSMSQATNTPTCQNNAAAMVYCWMDQRGMVANGVVVPRDSDGDHVYDSMDAHPGNPFLP